MKIPSSVIVILIIGLIFIITGAIIMFFNGGGAYFLSIGIAVMAGGFYYTLYSYDNKEKNEIEEKQ